MPEYTESKNVVSYKELNFQVNMQKGYFLILSRYPSLSEGFSEGNIIYAKLSLDFLSKFSDKSEDLIGILDTVKKHGGTYMNARDVSDLCVNIFDTNAFGQFFNDVATFAFETEDGQIIEQHST